MYGFSFDLCNFCIFELFGDDGFFSFERFDFFFRFFGVLFKFGDLCGNFIFIYFYMCDCLFELCFEVIDFGGLFFFYFRERFVGSRL